MYKGVLTELKKSIGIEHTSGDLYIRESSLMSSLNLNNPLKWNRLYIGESSLETSYRGELEVLLSV